MSHPVIGDLKQMVLSKETFEPDDNDTVEVEVDTLDAETFTPSAALKAAIDAGHVTTKTRTVEVKAKDKAGNVTKVYRQAYTQCFATNEQGALALPGVDGDESKIWDFVSARADANVYQPIYVKLRNAAAGPEKAVAKISKLFAGLTPDQIEAAKAALREAGVL